MSGGGTETITTGGTSFETTVFSGGTDLLETGGLSVSASLAAAASQVVSGGTAVGTVLASGEETSGSAYVFGAQAVVVGGGTAIDLTAATGASLFISGGTAVDAVLSAGAIANLPAGLVAATDVAGVLVIGSAGTAVGAMVELGGTEVVIGGLAQAGMVSAGGTEIVSAGGTAVGTVLESGGLLSLEAGGAAAFTDLSQGGTLELSGLAYDGSGSAGVTAGDELVLSTAGGTYSQPLTGDYGSGSFALAANGSGGTLVTFETLPCFRAGTRILTDRGEVPVEKLAVGDGVVTANGEVLPVIWLGERAVDCRRHRHPAKVRPVRIAAHAFGPGLPARSLDLSPDHAVFAVGVLIPVKHLINGASIRQIPAGRVRYLHIELPTHAIIFAEGLPTESYLDTGDRRSFAGDVVALHPAWGNAVRDTTLVMDALGAAALRVVGPEVEAVRTTLAMRMRHPDGGQRACRRQATGRSISRR